MIFSANTQSIFALPGNLPNMSDALLDWFQAMTFTRVAKSVVGHELVEVLTPVVTRGVRQVFTPQQVLMKPEGQRSWKWEMIHALPDLVLGADEVIVFAGQPYRVKDKIDHKEYGYVEYHIIQDFTA